MLFLHYERKSDNKLSQCQCIFLFFPLRSLWISEERELVHEIAGLGELQEPWHSSQMRWLENHLSLINTYSTALENLDNYRGILAS